MPLGETSFQVVCIYLYGGEIVIKILMFLQYLKR